MNQSNHYYTANSYTKMENKVEKPSLFWLMSEPTRAFLEMGLSYPLNSFKKVEKTGDGHPVFVLPGYMGSEKSTTFLRNYIASLGYEVYDWGLGRNVGKIEYLALLTERVDEIFKKTGKKISIIGWSLGGVFGRQIAKERPDIIRQIITLGSPFAGLAEPNNVEWIYMALNGGKRVRNVNKSFLDDLPNPAPVPTTAIYSKEDGIVSWQMCMEKEEDSLHQNIQVHGSHIGLGINTAVLTVIEDRLKLNAENWRKFKAEGFFNQRLLFPK
jgi:alpha/beta superfamily hydrolase